MFKKINVKSFFTPRSVVVRVMAAAVFLSITGAASQADNKTAFDSLLGSWGGSGLIKLQGGKQERIQCTAYYTGGGTQLGMNIRCTSDAQKIEMRSKLSLNADNVSGNWEERTYNAAGQVSGTVGKSKMTMSISGGVKGGMDVSYSRTSQKVIITTEGIGLESVNISLSRR